jgi:hypothetical protein
MPNADDLVKLLAWPKSSGAIAKEWIGGLTIGLFF